MSNVNYALAREQVTLDRLCAAAKAFYENPDNVKAYEAWKKEANKNENYGNHGLDRRQP